MTGDLPIRIIVSAVLERNTDRFYRFLQVKFIAVFVT